MDENVKYYVLDKVDEPRVMMSRSDGISEDIPQLRKASKDFYQVVEWLREVCTYKMIAVLGLGFIMSIATVLNSMMPFGIAYYAAISSSYRKSWILLFATTIIGYSIILGKSMVMPYFLVLVAISVVLQLYPIKEGTRWYMLPVIVFSVSLVIRGVILIFSTATDFMLMLVFFESLFAAGLSLIYSVTYDSWKDFKLMDKLNQEQIICTFVFIVSLIMGLSGIEFYEVNLGKIASSFVIMVAAMISGPGGGAAIGALTGICPSISIMVVPSIIGVYAFSGLLGGAFKSFGRLGVFIGFMLGNLILALYLLNVELIVASAVNALIAGGLLLLLPKGICFRLEEIFTPTMNTFVKGEEAAAESDYIVRQLLSASEGLEAVRYKLCELDRDNVPVEEKNIQSILKHISTRVCLECSLKKMCWTNDFQQLYKEIMTMFGTVEANGVLTSRDLPKSFNRRCSHVKEMVATINFLFEMYQKNDYWQEQINGSHYLALNHLENSANLLAGMANSINSHKEFRELLQRDLSKRLRKNGLAIDEVYIGSIKDKQLELFLKMRSCKGDGCCRNRLSSTINELASKEYQLRDYVCGNPKDGELCHCTMMLGGALHLDMGSTQIIKQGSSMSGDSKDCFYLSNCHNAMVISDGMGSGHNARKEADDTIAIVKEIMNCGFSEELAVNVVNYQLLMKRENDMYATVDICLVDLYKGMAEFIKVGASPSYIYGKKGLRVIEGNSIPMSFVRDSNMLTFKEQVEKGDIILMLSDGLLDTGKARIDMEFWITKLLDDSKGLSPKLISEKLAKGAASFNNGEAKDDITVLVAIVTD